MGLIIQLRKSFVASIALLAYSIFNVIVILVTTQTFGGWLILAAGIYAIASTYKLNKAFKNYLATGVIPSNMPVNQNNQGVA